MDPYEINQEVSQADSQEQRVELLNSYIGSPQVWNRYAYTLNSPLRLVDPNGECSAPPYMQEYQTGVCIEAFISTNRFSGLGYGDNRTFAATDPTKTARATIYIWIDPGSNGLIQAERRSATSKVQFLPDLPGRTDMEPIGGFTDEQGTRHFTVTFESQNGYQNVLGWLGELAVPGTIRANLIFSVTPSGDVTLDHDKSGITGYPSFAGYSYRIGAKGEPQAKRLFEASENDLSKLREPLIPVP